MKAGPSGNPTINATIERLVPILPERAAKRILRKFAVQDPTQNLHTFHELVVGAHLCGCTYKVEYERQVDDKTPDWTVLTSDDQPSTIVEVTTLHADYGTEKLIQAPRDPITPFVGWPLDAPPRLYSSIASKVGSYAAITQRIPFVVAIYAHFHLAIDDDDLNETLYGDLALFARLPELSGLLCVLDSIRGFQIRYFSNPSALLPTTITSGHM
jgi:hypothetical protein